MPRRHDDDEDDDFDPEIYGWTQDEWDELKELYGYEDDDEMMDAFPELVDFGDWMDELDYLDDVLDYEDDDDFYGG